MILYLFKSSYNRKFYKENIQINLMKTYTQILLELNPCGFKDKPETYCRYQENCLEQTSNEGRIVCISHAGFMLSKYLMESFSIRINAKMDLYAFIRINIGRTLVDPRENNWNPREIEKANIEKIFNQIETFSNNLTGNIKRVYREENN